MRRVLPCLILCVLLAIAPRTAAAEHSSHQRKSGFRLEAQGFGGVVLPDQTDVYRPGPVYGATILARPVWWLAAGVQWERASLGWHAQGLDFDEPDATITASGKSLAFRLYATDDTWAEPYMHLALTTYTVDVSISSADEGEGRGAQFGFGMDAYLLSWLRAGAWFGTMLGPVASEPIPLAGSSTPVPGWPANVVIRGGVTFVFGGPGDRGLISL